jgi:hypothetical protein
MALFKESQARGSSQLPKAYNIAANIQHLERVRPVSTAIGIALDKAAKAEGGLMNPMGAGPKGNPSVLRRLKLSTKAPKIEKSKFAPLKALKHG